MFGLANETSMPTCRPTKRATGSVPGRLQDRLFRLCRLTECADPAKKSHSSSGLRGFKRALMLRETFATNMVASPGRGGDGAVRALLEGSSDPREYCQTASTGGGDDRTGLLSRPVRVR